MADTNTSASNRDVSGRGMDRKVDRSKSKMMIGIAAGLGVLIVAAFVWAIRPAPAGYYVVDAKRLQIAAAEQGVMDEFVGSLAQVTPAQTVRLDAVEGGRVEKILVDSGDTVKAGQPLLVLSNTDLQLQLITRETEVQGQINDLREKEIAIERDKLQFRQSIAQNKARLSTLERDLAANEKLFEAGAYPLNKIKSDREGVDLQKELLQIEQERQAKEASMMSSQLEKMRGNTDRLEANLDIARAALGALTVKAPVAGTLTGFNPELGQSLAKNSQLGQIDSVADLKLTLQVDEYYLARFSSGLKGEAQIGDQKYELKVGRVSAQVENGTFKADLHFVGKTPESLRRGQSFPVKIFISEPAPALMLPNGPFITATGGRWAFVVNADGTEAAKRDITIGRRNAGAVEVLNGLKPGERVVVSDYEGFQTAKALQIKNGTKKK
jgi:HlyD family secretion protein